jgi:hypothetical protein
MSDRERKYRGRWFPDPEGFLITTRRWWRTEPLLDDERYKPWHPALFWQYICSLAVWDRGGRTVSRNGETVHLERGQFYHSYRFLGARPGWDKDTVARRLKRWAEEGRLRLEPRHRGTVVTILNYDPYQDLQFYTATQNATRARHKRDTSETNNNIPQGKQENIGGDPKTPQQQPDPETTWRDVRGSLQLGVFALAPASAQERMMRQAFAHGPPPDDIAHHVRCACDELGLDCESLACTSTKPSDLELRDLRQKLKNLIDKDGDT